MNVITTGLSEGDFHRLAILHNGSMTDIISLIGSLGGSGAVNSASTPLSISGGVLSIALTGYMPTTHEANNIAAADVDRSGFDLTAASITLKTPQGVTVVLTADNGGNVSIGSAGIATIPYITPLLNWKANSSQVLTNVPANALFTDTLYTHPSQHSMSMITGLQTALASKQGTLTVAAGVFLSNNTLSRYDWRWLTNGVPTIGGGIKCLHSN